MIFKYCIIIDEIKDNNCMFVYIFIGVDDVNL